MVEIAPGPGSMGVSEEEATSAEVGVALGAGSFEGSPTVAWLGLQAESFGDLPPSFVGVELTPEDCRLLAAELLELADGEDSALALLVGLAWQRAVAAIPGDHTGPTIDRGDGVWVASAFPPITDEDADPDPVDAEGETVDEALGALAAKFEEE